MEGAWAAELAKLREATRAAPPATMAEEIRSELGIDLRTHYAGMEIPHPFGKASGQLSFTPKQVEADVRAGLGFVVLKTVIAERADGRRSMEAWALPQTRMRVERRRSERGRLGWTVTWQGRGWSGSLREYLRFARVAYEIGMRHGVPVVPSVKYHFPAAGEPLDLDEYRHTTEALLAAWRSVHGDAHPMPLEVDFSPTLAGDPRASDPERILHWMREVPRAVAQCAERGIRLGLKLMNALFDDTFQVALVRAAAGTTPRPAFLVVFNRLYDPARHTAYGGWDLSDRNLRVLEQLGNDLDDLPPLSGTGNICSGRVMLEYILRGCENGQVHTFFQLPYSHYTARGGSRTARALHTLLLHPREGLAVWVRHLHEAGLLEASGGVVRLADARGKWWG